MNNLQALAQQLLKLDNLIADCMRCGMCQAVCPMFSVSGQEGDVARGKLFLIDNMAHMLLSDPQALADKLGRCLLCSSCQAACPAGVQIMEVFREAREAVYSYIGLSPLKKLIFGVLLAKPGLFNWSMRAAPPLQNLLFKKTDSKQGTVCAPMFNLLLGDRHIRPLAKKPLHAHQGFVDETRKQNGLKIAFFPGCLGDKMYVEMSQACLKVLKKHDVAVFMPDKFACCGIPAVCSGDANGMLKELKSNLEILAKGDFDYILTPCASCASTLIELWPKYAARLNDPRLQELAEHFASITMEISVFLTRILGIKPVQAKAGAKTVSYHDPCHMLKSLGVSEEPRNILQANPDYKFREMKDHDRCCGSGGSFNLFHYDYSRKIGQKKRDNIVDSGAHVIATACPACMMQLEDALSRNRDPIQVKHVVEVYAESLD